MIAPSTKPFGEALADLLGEEQDVYVTPGGRVKIKPLAEDLEGVSTGALRRAVLGERRPSVDLMEECARFLRVRPEYFAEYRAEHVRRLLEPEASRAA